MEQKVKSWKGMEAGGGEKEKEGSGRIGQGEKMGVL